MPLVVVPERMAPCSALRVAGVFVFQGVGTEEENWWVKSGSQGNLLGLGVHESWLDIHVQQGTDGWLDAGAIRVGTGCAWN